MFDSHTSHVLKNLEQTAKDFWNISRPTANFLNMLIKISNSKKALELGTSNGYSGIWLAKALKENNGTLTTIEFYDKRRDLALANFKTCNVDDVIISLKGSICDILADLPENEFFDFVFIDANKAESIKYFELINPHLKKGAIITCDNVTSHAEKVASFVNKIQMDENYQVEILNLPAGLLLAYKLNN